MDAGAPNEPAQEPSSPRDVVIVGALTLLLCGVLLYAVRLSRQAVFGDYIFMYVPMARRMDAAPWDVRQWVHPFYPFGYPLLVWLLGSAGGYLLAGKLISALAAAAALPPLFGLARTAFGRVPALLSVAFCCVNAPFLERAREESADLLAASLVLWSAYLYLRTRPLGTRGAILSGLVAGLAFVVRYQSAVVVLATATHVLWTRSPGRRALAFYLAAFGLAAAPQLVANAVVTGWPLPGGVGQAALNAQATGLPPVAFLASIEARDMSVSGLLERRSLVDVLRHCFRQAFAVAPRVEWVGVPLGLLSWAGFLVAALGRRPRGPAGYLALLLAMCLGLSSWFLVDTRRAILAVPLFTILATGFLWRSLGTLLGRRATVAMAACFLALMGHWYLKPVLLASNYDARVPELSGALRERGMGDPGQVANLSISLYDATGGDVTPYPVVLVPMYREGVDGWGELVGFLRQGGYRFAVAQRDDVGDAFPGLALFKPDQAPPELSLVYFSAREPAIVAYQVGGP